MLLNVPNFIYIPEKPFLREKITKKLELLGFS